MKITSRIDTKTSDYKSNYDYNLNSINVLKQKLETVSLGGGKEARARQLSQGKLPVRDRIELLLDDNCAFLELSALAGEGLYEEIVPSGSIITGVGIVQGRTCMIIANDPSVKGGTYFPITLKKHLRAQEIAEKNFLPCIYLVDSGGAYLPMQDQVFPDKEHFGRLFYNQARMSALGIPQISSVHGMCTAGGAYIPAMSDQSVIVDGQGYIFLAGPPLVKAATGEEVTAEELGGAKVHCNISGVTDHIAKDDQHAIQILKDIVKNFGYSYKAKINIKQPKAPIYDPEEILGILPQDRRKFFDVREILARIVDDSELFEFKPNYGNTLVCGFSHIEGIPVGILANNGILFSESALKATHFIEICGQEKIPLLFFQNITGFMVGKKYENAGIAKDGAKMVHAVSNVSVPKLTTIIGGSFGAGNYGMCGRAYDPDYLFMWPEAKISVMGAQQAADVLVTVKEQQLARKSLTLSESERQNIKTPILEKYEKESSAYYSSARLWDDGVIDPRQTRSILAMGLSSTLFHEWNDTKYGIFRT